MGSGQSEQGNAAMIEDDTITSEPDERDVDGRTLRRTRNRDAVLDALISLIREGNLGPTVEAIADRAGVSHRSIFRYFTDLDDLASTAIEREFARVGKLVRIAEPGTGDFETRLTRLIDTQLVAQVEMHMLARMAFSKSITIPAVDQQFAAVTRFRVDQLRHHFAPELSDRTAVDQTSLATSIAAMVSIHSFDVLHRVLGHSIDEIRTMWTATLRTLFHQSVSESAPTATA